MVAEGLGAEVAVVAGGWGGTQIPIEKVSHEGDMPLASRCEPTRVEAKVDVLDAPLCDGGYSVVRVLEGP